MNNSRSVVDQGTHSQSGENGKDKANVVVEFRWMKNLFTLQFEISTNHEPIPAPLSIPPHGGVSTRAKQWRRGVYEMKEKDTRKSHADAM